MAALKCRVVGGRAGGGYRADSSLPTRRTGGQRAAGRDPRRHNPSSPRPVALPRTPQCPAGSGDVSVTSPRRSDVPVHRHLCSWSHV